MKQILLGYLERESPIHQLTGATKLICLILCSFTTMLTYDTRVLVGMLIFSLIIFKISQIKMKEIAFVFYFILVFLVINNLAIFIFSPYEGVKIYNSKTELFKIAGYYSMTAEQLFYHLNITLKYLALVPMTLLFMVATHPSEFAASLSRIGVSYRIAYAVAIALRYIPDVQRDYQNIAFAAQARGIDMSKKEKLVKRLRNITSILIPLIFSSLQRIDTISCAMELRAFGSRKKRTWYREKNFAVGDYIALAVVTVLFILSLFITASNEGRFYNPFH
jgi:energy-coupling factor transport system permease protein